jgi:hypothetical protein
MICKSKPKSAAEAHETMRRRRRAVTDSGSKSVPYPLAGYRISLSLCTHSGCKHIGSRYRIPYVPHTHIWAGDLGESDGAAETLVTLETVRNFYQDIFADPTNLRIIVLKTDLKLHCLQKVPLLLVVGIIQQFFNVRANAGD